MKKKTRIRILALALAAVLCTSGLITGRSLTAQAADVGIGKLSETVVDRTGVAVTGNTIMFGENNLVSVEYPGTSTGTGDEIPIKWRVVAKDGKTLTLLADNTLGKRWQNPSGHQKWSGSDICNYLNGTDSIVNDGETREYATSGGFLQKSFSEGVRDRYIMV